MAARIVPYMSGDEIIPNAILDDTEAVNTNGDIVAARTRYLSEYSQQKLNEIHDHLWSAGRKGNIGALHHQRVLCRKVVLSERSDLHLVWFDRIIYVHPLPISFLNYNFINAVILPDANLYGIVLGFLYSYMMLIQHPSDLSFAHELGLISEQVEWKCWIQLRIAFLGNFSSGRIPRTLMNKRFEYGELRLARLNYIYWLSFRGLKYFSTHREYNTYFRQYTAAGITLFAFVTVALTAMQVVVGMSSVSQALVQTSFRFSIIVLCVVAIFSAAVFGLFAVLFLVNAGLAIQNSFFV